MFSRILQLSALLSMICVFPASAQNTRYDLHFGYGVTVSVDGRSCRGDHFNVDVASPYFAKTFSTLQSWDAVLYTAMKRLMDLCKANTKKWGPSTVNIRYSGTTIATAQMDYLLNRSGSDLRVTDFTLLLDETTLQKSGLPSERFWDDELVLTPEVEQELIARDTGEDYYALAFKLTEKAVESYYSEIGLPADLSPDAFAKELGYASAEALAAAGFKAPVVNRTLFGPIEPFDPLRDANLDYLTKSADLGFPPALSILAQSIIRKMQTLDRSTRRLTYSPDQITGSDRDQLSLIVAKLFLQNTADGIQTGQLLTELGFDIQRAVDVVNRVGLSANTGHLRKAPESEREPTRFEMVKAFRRALIDEKCDPLKVFLETGSVLGAISMRADGNACVWSDKNTTRLGYSLRLSVDQIFSPVCQKTNGGYSCGFRYNLYCDASGQGTDGLFSAVYCTPFTIARQPTTALFSRTNEGWTAKDIVLH